MITVIPQTAYRAIPWKNGQGVTHDIAAEERVPYGWRLSIATIDRDGPFSDFSGYDRTIMTLDGGDVELHFHDDNRTVKLTRYVPFVFSGDVKVSSHLLAGPVRDFNVMTYRTRFSHTSEILSTERAIAIAPPELCFALVLSGSLSTPGVAKLHDTIVTYGPETVTFTPGKDGTYLLIHIKPSMLPETIHKGING